MITPLIPCVTDDLIAELDLDVEIATELCMPAVLVDPGHLKAILAERAELKRDAERYRWLRGKQTFIWMIRDWFPVDADLIDVDAEIDAAREKKNE